MQVAYYGDDFTGSTDVLETLAAAGLAADLCVTVAAAAERLTDAARGGLQALGIAGQSRTWSPAAMDAELPAAFATLAAARPRFLHYKVCSTFDSSPAVGSIGHAIDIGRRVLPARWTPVVAAAPHLGRWMAFGNLFARSGLDSPAYRLDRHPTMSRHPVTPMAEADLRLVLGRQTQLPVSLVDLPTLDAGVEPAWASIRNSPEGIVLFDATTDAQLTTIGRLLDRLADAQDQPLFVAGSSGVERALVLAGGIGQQPVVPPPARPGSSGPLLVVAGSLSPVTQRQLAAAVAAGFHDLEISPVAGESEIAAVTQAATMAHHAGRSVIIRLGAAVRSDRSGPELGRLLGRTAANVLAVAPFPRIIIAGGDTSGEVSRQLGITSLRFVAALAPGAPWCGVESTRPPVAAALFAFKGGQVGRDDLLVAAGCPSATAGEADARIPSRPPPPDLGPRASA